ncbi:hypothetical protein WR25_20784 [Diploscapter pachys]|uniref:Uncharacterized protein n=1 Tax=Diploscapter pachys TaxID=2018661 RepID=A0A2A2KDS7_9BILA|nr:hypothetical protein WR25_20784 [Diploscapter pachys]
MAPLQSMVNKDENSLDSFNDSTEETELDLRVETNLVLDISIQASPDVLRCLFGTSFIILYVFCTLLVATPVIVFEQSLGKYTSSSVVHIFSRIGPAFSGLGLSFIVVTFFSLLCNISIVIRGLLVFSEVQFIRQGKLRFQSCFNSLSMKDCLISTLSPCDKYQPSTDTGDTITNYINKRLAPRYVWHAGYCIIPNDESEMEVLDSLKKNNLESNFLGWLRAQSFVQFISMRPRDQKAVHLNERRAGRFIRFF